MKNRKIKRLAEVVKIAARAKKRGKKIVTTNGCFDLLHIGHIRLIAKAKSLGDILIVGVNSDRSVKANKGPARPVMPQNERAEMLAALEPVDYVFIFGEKIPDNWLKKIKPHVHAKGGDRKLAEIVERDILKKIGARLALLSRVKNRSTTSLIKKITEL